MCGQRKRTSFRKSFVLALPIFTARHQATIVGVSELNFCVRDGNRWTLTTINTNSHRMAFNHPLYNAHPLHRSIIRCSDSLFQRTHTLFIFHPSCACTLHLNGDPYRIRTDVNGVRGRCLNHLTNGPFGPLSGTRTRDPLIKSQLLYQLS